MIYAFCVLCCETARIYISAIRRKKCTAWRLAGNGYSWQKLLRLNVTPRSSSSTVTSYCILFYFWPYFYHKDQMSDSLQPQPFFLLLHPLGPRFFRMFSHKNDRIEDRNEPLILLEIHLIWYIVWLCRLPKADYKSAAALAIPILNSVSKWMDVNVHWSLFKMQIESLKEINLHHNKSGFFPLGVSDDYFMTFK